jgi:hypothetical protein
MRIALLADIHGNLPAFEAALQHASAQKPDQLVLAGDIINGAPDSKACWELALSLDCPILRGNHERYAAHYDTPAASPLWSTEIFAPLHWTLAQLTEQDRHDMDRLPLTLRLPDAPDLLIVHASQRSDADSIRPHTPAAALVEMFPSAAERWLVRAHNHYAQVRLWEDRFVITAGSTGLPLDGTPTAQYLLIDQTPTGWRFLHQSVPYDLDCTLQRFHASGYLAQTGPMGRLFYREVLTATQQLVPFLRLYNRWNKEEQLDLNTALDRFLNHD